MSIKTIFFALATFMLTFSCGNLEEQRWEEVMAVHDEVMPKMSEINRLSRSLREYVENNDSLDPQMGQRIDAVLQDLSNGEEGMWNWMNNLKQLDSLREQMSHQEIMDYLKEEKASIDKVRDDMLRAIEEATKLAEELEIQQTSQ